MPKFKIDPWFDPSSDKELKIVSDSPFEIILDYDDVNHSLVEDFAKFLVKILNGKANQEKLEDLKTNAEMRLSSDF